MIEELLTRASPGILSVSLVGLIVVLTVIYRILLDPLRDIPGPLVCRLTSFWVYYHSYVGDECTAIDRLHSRYGPVVRIAPNEVIISDGAALAPVYSDRGGFLKAPCYQNFDFDGHATIFSTRDPTYRGTRAKAVLPLFSTTNIRSRSNAIEACVDRMIRRLEDEAEESEQAKKRTGKATPVNVLDIARSLALDAVSSYLFSNTYGAIEEDSKGRLSANGFVDSAVAIGRLFYLPNWIFVAVENATQKILSDPEQTSSYNKVNDFSASLVQNASTTTSNTTTYQSRLLTAGISPHETTVQCNDLIFAGTDSTGNNFSTILHHLAKHPSIHTRLRAEIAHADATLPADYNPQTLPYLDAVIREALRVSMANPTRFPRVVPPQGFTFTPSAATSSTKSAPTYHLPPGTLVGLQPWTLHFNPAVFSDPHEFKPERWLVGAATPEMQRDWIPFGLGARGCIARNLALAELFLATRAVARSGVMEGAGTVVEKVEIVQWFNSRIVGDKVELVWEG